jgi:hypothetical protein
MSNPSNSVIAPQAAIDALLNASANAEGPTLLTVSATNGLLLSQIDTALQTMATNSGEAVNVQLPDTTTLGLSEATITGIGTAIASALSCTVGPQIKPLEKGVTDLQEWQTRTDKTVNYLSQLTAHLDADQGEHRGRWKQLRDAVPRFEDEELEAKATLLDFVVALARRVAEVERMMGHKTAHDPM